MSSESSRLEREVVRHVLRDRAFRASHRHESARPEGKVLLTFHLGGETYALEATRVREVVSLTQRCRIPGAHPTLRGVTNIRGGFVTILDTCRLLDLPRDEEARYLLVLELSKRQFALEVALPIDLAHVDEAILEDRANAADDGGCHRPIVLGGKPVGVISPERLLARLPRTSATAAPSWGGG